ncbi:MAG: sigma-70 family RNA polymerase sigma factor [Planctomycetales bacterium]|nr:sigma-70 family RNA polymerase sigma factor [Planctomycetales bacterium]
MADISTNGQHRTELLIERATQGERQAFDELILHVSGRLCEIAHGMLARYPRVRRWEETDDIMQDALLKLHRSLSVVQPKSAAEFFGLAATQLRRILIDLSRHYYGVYGAGTRHHSDHGGTLEIPAALESVANSECPDSLDEWTSFHQAIEQLSDPEKETFSMMWYSGLTQRQIAQLSGISERTVIRRLNRARLSLHEKLHDPMPSS